MTNSDKTNSKTSNILVIALRELSFEEDQELVKKANGERVDCQTPDRSKIKKLNQNDVQLIDVNKIYQKSYEDAFSDVLSFGELSLTNGVKLADQLMAPDGKSWWYYFRFMALYKYRSKLNDHRLAMDINEHAKSYRRVHVYHSSGYIKQNLSDNIEGYKRSVSNKNLLLNNLLRYLIIFCVRSVIGLFQIGRLFASKKHILLTNAQPNQTVIRKQDLAEIRGDHFAEYLQDAIQFESDFLNISELYPPNMKTEQKIPITKEVLIARHRGTLNLEIVLYLQLFNPWFYFRGIKGIIQVNKAFSQLKLSDGATKEEEFIVSIIPSFKRMCYFLVVRKAALKWLFKVKRYKTVGGTNEHDPRVKSILETAKICGSKTYGIQHGVIHPRHMHYCFTSKDVDHGTFPDLTFLWGQHWANYLTEGSSYPNAQLHVVGQIRSDVIDRLKEVPKSELITVLDSKKQTVLYPSQPLYVGEEEMRTKLATDFLKLTVDYPETQFIIKPHPKELDCERFMGNIAKKLGTSNFHVLRGDLYKTIAATDLVIVFNSTVGAEAVYFSKPLLVMDYSHNDFSGFISSGIGIEVLDYEQLKIKVGQLLSGELQVNKVAQETFVKERGYQIDGKVTARIIEKLKDF